MQKTLITYLFGLLCLAFISGCITKQGSGLNTGNLVKGPDGIWRLKDGTYPEKPKLPPTEKKTPPIKKNEPIVVPPVVVLTHPVPKEPARSRPKPPIAESAVGETLPLKIKPAEGKLEPFTPTVNVITNGIISSRTGATQLSENEENIEIQAGSSHNIEITTGKLIMTYLIIFLLLTVAYQGWVIHGKLKSKPEPKPKKRNTSKKAIKKTIESKSKRASVLAAKKTGKKKAAKKKK